MRVRLLHVIFFMTVANVAAMWYFTGKPVEDIAWNRSDGPGFVRRVYVDENGASHRYLVFIPFELAKNEKPPLLLFLCGFGEYGDDGVRHLTNTLGPQLWDQKSQFPFVVVFPQCRVESNWDAHSLDVKWALAMLDEVAKEFHTDPDRVYLSGASSGGQGAWSVAEANPERFAAVAPLCGVIPSSAAATFADAHLPIWSFVNSADDPELVGRHREMYEALLANGASPHYTEVVGDGHDSWNYALRNPALYEWLLQQTRSKNAANRSRFTLLLNSDDLASWESEGGGTWRMEPGHILNGESSEAASPARLVSQAEYADFELHLDFQLKSGTGWSLQLPGSGESEASAAGWSLQVVAADRGSGGIVVENDKRCLQPCDSLAQSSLKTQGWNDLRVRVFSDEVSATLNGWKLVEFRDPVIARRLGKIALALPGGKASQVVWKNLRISEAIAIGR